MEALGPSGMIATRTRLDVADVDDMAEQFALPGLWQRRADISAQPEIDPRHVIGGIAFARDAAQQHEAAAEAQLVAQTGEYSTQRRQREGLARDGRKVEL